MCKVGGLLHAGFRRRSRDSDDLQPVFAIGLLGGIRHSESSTIAQLQPQEIIHAFSADDYQSAGNHRHIGAELGDLEHRIAPALLVLNSA